MREWSCAQIMELTLIELSNQLRAMKRNSELDPREEARQLIAISREMREISQALRELSEKRYLNAQLRRNASLQCDNGYAIAAE